MPADNLRGDSSADLNTNSQVVVPVRTQQMQQKPGQIDWVKKLDSAEHWKRWRYTFQRNAKVYLSKIVYPDDEMRHDAYIVALLKAAEGSKIQEKLETLIQLHDEVKGVKCEEMLDGLERDLLPMTETDRRLVIDQFMKFQRGAKSLLDAVTELSQLVLKCKQLKFEPNDDTVTYKYMSLLNREENALYGPYYSNTGNGSELEKTIQAVEAMARKLAEVGTCSVNMANGISCAANGNGNYKGNGKKPKRAGFNSNGKKKKARPCGKCGRKSCEGGGKCSAADLECYKCGKTGHLQAMCRSAGKGSDGKAAAATSVGSASMPDFK